MSSVANHSDRLRAKLVAVKDAMRLSYDCTSYASLSTVMGTGACTAGSLKRAARKALVTGDNDLVAAMAGVNDSNLLVDEMQKLIQRYQTQLESDFLDNTLKELDAAMNNGARKHQMEAVKAINEGFTMLRDLTTEAIKNDVTMTTDRITAIADFEADILMVESTMDHMAELEQRIKEIQLELTNRYDPTDLLATAKDSERQDLANLRKSIEDQRNFAERSMLEHFDNTAKTRSNTSKVYAQDLVIPEQLTKGKGSELEPAMDTYCQGRSAEMYAVRPYIKRIPKDFNSEQGIFWKPPTKADGYSDVSPKFRERYEAQSQDLWNLFVRKLGVTTMNTLTYTFKVGVNKQIEHKCEEGDGVTAYYALLSLYRPSESSHRESVLTKLDNSHEHFKKGDPKNTVKHMKTFLTDAIKLQMRLKWSIGRKIINVLSSRHNIFAVRLQPLISTAPNQDDSAAYIDRLISEIVDCCNDISSAQGENWHQSNSARADFVHDDTKSHGKPQCKYGDKCRFKDSPTGCRFGHGDSSKNRYGSDDSKKDKTGNICHHKPCKQRSSGKDKKFCTTCFKKGLQDGVLPMKNGKDQSFKKASRATKTKDKDKKTKSDGNGFNPTQIKILSGMHSMALQSQEDEEDVQGIFQAASARGPASHKKRSVLERLGAAAARKQPKIKQAIADQVLAITQGDDSE